MKQIAQNITPEKKSRSGLRLLAASLLILLFAACASAPPAPNDALQAAQLAIENAEQARVSEYAAAELRDAREDLADARRAVQDEDMVLARRLAVQSRANAELASAKAGEAKARAINEEMQKSIDALKQELQRNAGDRS